MYGLKEKTIGKLLIRIMQISKDSEDGYNLMNWKQPGQSAASRMAGDFAGRCYEVITKRPMRTEGKWQYKGFERHEQCEIVDY